MEKRKEFIKSVLLFVLVVSSILLTFNIVGYKPEYDILGTKQEKQKANQDISKLRTNTLNLLSPNIILRKQKDAIEEKAQKNAIVKMSTLPAIKDRGSTKNILNKISEYNIEESRLRNRKVEEVLVDSNNYYLFKYNNKIDTISAKIIYSGENSSTSSFDFDEVLISDSKPNNIYLYKKGDENYFQIEYGVDIFAKVTEQFNNHAEDYTVYNIDAREDIYIKNEEEFYVDTYSYRSEDISTVANNIFVGNSNIKISNRDVDTKEVTDGYSLLREVDNFITYINPSNINNGKIQLQENDIESKASSFLVTGYLPDQDYTISKIFNNEIMYQEVYKDGLVFANDYSNYIKIAVTSDGVANAKYPRLIRNNQVSSDKVKLFAVENISELLNYLYSNVKLENVDDVLLGYEKTYSKNENLVYTPAWYVKYKNEYVKYSVLKEKIAKGEA